MPIKTELSTKVETPILLVDDVIVQAPVELPALEAKASSLSVVIDSPAEGLAMFRKQDSAVLVTVRDEVGGAVEDALVELYVDGVKTAGQASEGLYVLPFKTGMGSMKLEVVATRKGQTAKASVPVNASR